MSIANGTSDSEREGGGAGGRGREGRVLDHWGLLSGADRVTLGTPWGGLFGRAGAAGGLGGRAGRRSGFGGKTEGGRCCNA